MPSWTGSDWWQVKGTKKRQPEVRWVEGLPLLRERESKKGYKFVFYFIFRYCGI
jgi:hypothetical protein